MDAKPASHGIEGLIARLHGDGVEAGRREAERIMEQARIAARETVLRAREEADALREEARAAAAAEHEAGRQALSLARRDALLALKEELCVHLAGRLQRLTAQAVADPDLLRRVLLAAVGAEKLANDGDLDRLLSQVTGSMLAEGGGIGASQGRVRICAKGADVIVDVSGQSLTELLSAHLMPRFLARLNGGGGD